MFNVNDWHDWVRILVILTNAYNAWVLLSKWQEYSIEWNNKTRDYWYCLLMWVFAGLIVSVQGIYFDRPFTPGVVFVTAATLATARGLYRPGAWGGSA